MSSHRDGAGADRITIKIHNMKRSASRSPGPAARSSLSRNSRSMGRGYDNGSGVPGDSPERLSPERMRRRLDRSPSPRGRYGSPHREPYLRGPPPAERPAAYKVLCVSALPPKAPDEFIEETLYREYKKFGDFSVRLAHDLDERVAYVCFRTPEDAREAKHHKPRLIIYDKMAIVEPVYKSTTRPEYRYGFIFKNLSCSLSLTCFWYFVDPAGTPCPRQTTSAITTRAHPWARGLLWITAGPRLIPMTATVLRICIRMPYIHGITGQCTMTIHIRHAVHLCIAAAILITSMATHHPISTLL